MIEPPPQLIIKRGQRPTALARLAWRCIENRHASQVAYEGGEIVPERWPEPALAAPGLPGVGTTEPPQHRPAIGILTICLPGMPDPRDGNGQPPEMRQPGKLYLEAASGTGTARKPHHKIGSEPIQGIVGPGVAQRFERQPAQFRSLLVQEIANNLWAGVRLILVKRRRHRTNLASIDPAYTFISAESGIGNVPAGTFPAAGDPTQSECRSSSRFTTSARCSG